MLANLLHLRLQPYTTVFKAIQSYKNSPAQKHLHSYIRDNNHLNEIKKGIDYETVNKNSKGRFTIREFVFQQKIEQNYIRPLDCYLLPLGKWTREEIKQSRVGTNKTASEVDNEIIISTCAPALESIFKEYYDKSGKRGYKFILSQEIGKISNMSAQQFNNFVKVLGGDTQEILKNLAKIQR